MVETMPAMMDVEWRGPVARDFSKDIFASPVSSSTTSASEDTSDDTPLASRLVVNGFAIHVTVR